MRKSVVVKLNEIEDLKAFVNEIGKLDFSINARSLNRSAEYDAKSIMALLSLDLSQPIEIIANIPEYLNISDFENVVNKYKVN
ncbi:HPr family phosphocarrier protein [uncultured Eubacterium sp.]|uniref:HPr family phosphocarrier protein n=1 Tax=uncultured Eubacterium sp. TaxID=165185 RepID=UPI0025997A5B|nr:HPr family phosphocarrier protein [uncultured Eubacterium sp.]